MLNRSRQTDKNRLLFPIHHLWTFISLEDKIFRKKNIYLRKSSNLFDAFIVKILKDILMGAMAPMTKKLNQSEK